MIKCPELLEGLTQDELNSFYNLTELRTFQRDEQVLPLENRAKPFYIVKEGRAEVRIHGEKIIQYNIGDFFGEVGFCNQDFRAGAIVALEPLQLYAIYPDAFYSSKLPAPTALTILKRFTHRITYYLHTNETMSTALILKKGESEKVEFKSTIRQNIHTQKPDKRMEHAVLKSIGAFLNSQGGTLLIGVDDEGNILGIGPDKFSNNDKALLHITNLVKTKLSAQSLCSIKMAAEVIDELTIIRIDVRPASTPIYMMDAAGNVEIFYVRTGPSTTQLKVSEIHSYISTHF